ncbi:MAG: methylmalonyl Co-A mutase-associated GTPase MeaB [Luminiphilus sp.]|nr:methylmalonyl Co-A mutase-associated GTPase MeaB [Luminiphilus sp.]MBL6820581.1 methylmalonyl Co-A mutase-associated GTPase MeaB [Luminiphilus sp.]
MRSTPTAEAILAGDRRALAKAITLVESQLPADRDAAQALLTSLLPHTGRSIRVGITGVPGVGKSTFIEAFGQHVIDHGHRLAVLAVDPSSPVAGGSILGDKTRMETLSRSESAFIRPSPAGKALGGVAFKTRESLMLCEAAGFDVVLVETVGVGQSEHQVAGMVDFFLLLMLPGGGDELQGIKKGILELADAIVVNKADGASEALARTTQQHYRGAMSLLSHDGFWEPRVMTCSALHGVGISEVWETITDFAEEARVNGAFEKARAGQNFSWMRQLVDEMLRSSLSTHPAVQGALPAIEEAVRSAQQTPLAAAQQILALSREPL